MYLQYRRIARAMAARMRRGGHGGRGGYRRDTDPTPPQTMSSTRRCANRRPKPCPTSSTAPWKQMNGKTIPIRTPAELAKALIEIERRDKKRTASAQLTR